MKLSEKGISKIWSFIHKGNLKSALFSNTIDFGPDDFEEAIRVESLKFEVPDFKDCVVLPIEEARIIEHCLAFFKQRHKLYNTELKVWKLLQMRIEQAEKKNEV